MGGKFNPFQSRQSEVVRTHTVARRTKAMRIFEKVQRKRACDWLEVQDINDPAAEQKLNELSGETSVALFIEAAALRPAETIARPAVDALITRLWKNFNKLYLIQRVEGAEESASEDEVE